jgi:hypothetical protein
MWCEQHRDKAPRLFVEELATVVAKLRHGADDERQRCAARPCGGSFQPLPWDDIERGTRSIAWSTLTLCARP